MKKMLRVRVWIQFNALVLYYLQAAGNPDWQPLSILAINIDSLSRAQFHRGSCGLPKTAKLLRQLYYTETEEGDSKDLDYQAFMFNRLNSIGGVTAMNLTPLYAGKSVLHG